MRILLKLSGEALAGDTSSLDHEVIRRFAGEIREARDAGTEVAVVIGGGNIFRGRLAKELGFERTSADQVGMLATAVNGLLLSQALKTQGLEVAVMSAIPIEGFVERYIWEKALTYMEEGRIVIFVGGTGNPYFTTDTAAALRACEMKVDLLVKGTKVDGIYDRDPNVYQNAIRYERITYAEVLTKKLNVMDGAAIAICREHNIPVRVVNVFSDGALVDALVNQSKGTLVQ